MLHRIFAVHGGHAERTQLPGEVACALHRDERIVGAVLHEHGRRVVLVEVEGRGLERRAHRERGLGPGSFAALEREPQGEPGALREAADDRLRSVELQRVGLLGEQVVELGERFGVRAFRLVALEHPVPRVTGAARDREVAPRQHDRQRPVGIEVRQQAAEVLLVGAVAVNEHGQAVRARSFDDVRNHETGR